ncbi:MAG: glycosyltransferase family 1 protein [Pyrinomonadaceae bacterium]
MNGIKQTQGGIKSDTGKETRGFSATDSGQIPHKNVISREIHQSHQTAGIMSFSAPRSTAQIFKTVVESSSGTHDLVCLSHLRWDFVYQRPQHILSRCAKERRVFFFEEPIFDESIEPRLEMSEREDGLCIVVPHLPESYREDAQQLDAVQKLLIDRLFDEQGIDEHILWYYTPMALGFTRHLQPSAVVYDCMDELSAFKNAPPTLKSREAELFRRTDLVFTGGQSLYEAKRNQHPHVYAFPSSIDTEHFMQARGIADDPADQASIAHPRMGFCGVIDERLDLELLDGAAEARPDWQFVMIGPVVKIDPASLPRRANIHYLGGKNYKELPAYMSGWDVALMPFARNESTRFISPTKTPEYLAAGCPVVSTSIRDVVRPYGQQKMVHIADTVADFVAGIEAAMQENADERLRRADAFLAQNSWRLTWSRMSELIEGVVARHDSSVNAAATMPLRARAAAAGATTAAAMTNSFASGD